MEPSNPENKNNSHEEHETHTTALVFLVIASLIIAYVALTYSNDISDTPGEDDQTPATTTEAEGSHGFTVPQEKIESSEATGVEGLPSDLYVEEENITRNDENSGGAQRIVIFTTQESSESLYANYVNWIEENDFKILKEVEDDYGVKISSELKDESADKKLTVSITLARDEGANQVKIDYVSQ